MSDTYCPAPSFPLPFHLPLACLLIPSLCAPNFSFNLFSTYHQPPVATPSSYKGRDRLKLSLSFLPLNEAWRQRDKWRQAQQAATWDFSFKCCPLPSFPKQYQRDCWEPELRVCTAHPNNSSLLPKVVLHLRVTPSMMKSTNCLTKVSTAVPVVERAICINFLQSINLMTSWDFTGTKPS